MTRHPADAVRLTHSRTTRAGRQVVRHTKSYDSLTPPLIPSSLPPAVCSRSRSNDPPPSTNGARCRRPSWSVPQGLKYSLRSSTTHRPPQTVRGVASPPSPSLSLPRHPLAPRRPATLRKQCAASPALPHAARGIVGLPGPSLKVSSSPFAPRRPAALRKQRAASPALPVRPSLSLGFRSLPGDPPPSANGARRRRPSRSVPLSLSLDSRSRPGDLSP
ncbi:hypothetical protein K488DRAFT_92896 [Vararia minispora EC-137]|uniref:Uncharacterized protein n=1 Tax=Vararia minispora EC-137 TaxID=1314806 RepID=A0ACB8Q3R8_9AGAM|nr:hypothetical protein K488DRAFT_92896 [Vararia minispora EC-137]